MSKKGIEDMINEIEIYVDSCKYQPLSSSKIVIPKEEMMSMLKELRMKIPSEIERCQKIMRNKEAILAEARSQAEKVASNAVQQASYLVDEHEIVQAANIRAEEIMATAQDMAQEMVDQANQEAEGIRVAAMEYTRDNLVNIEQLLHQNLVEETNKYNELLDIYQDHLNAITTNRQEVESSLGLGEPAAPEKSRFDFHEESSYGDLEEDYDD